MTVSGQIREAAIWRTVAEVTRRCPERLQVWESHGQAFVNLRWAGDAVNEGSIRIQRAGDVFYQPFHVGYQHEQAWRGYLGELCQSEDSYGPIGDLCRRCSLPVDQKLPPSTAAPVTYRAIAAFLAATLFGSAQWRCHNGVWDTSDGGWVQREYFSAVIPGVLQDLPPFSEPGFPRHPAYGYWFLLQDGQVKATVSTEGEFYDTEGEYWNLMDLYRQHHRIWPVVTTAMGHLLP